MQYKLIKLKHLKTSLIMVKKKSISLFYTETNREILKFKFSKPKNKTTYNDLVKSINLLMNRFDQIIVCVFFLVL